MNKKIIETDKAPAAIGPYSQAVIQGNLVFTSGQIPVSPATGKIGSLTISEQTGQAVENLSQILTACGSGLHCVIKTTVFIKDMNMFAEMNSVYSKFFTEPYPARSCIEASALPKNALIEIEAVAYIPHKRRPRD